MRVGKDRRGGRQYASRQIRGMLPEGAAFIRDNVGASMGEQSWEILSGSRPWEKIRWKALGERGSVGFDTKITYTHVAGLTGR